MAEVQGHGTCIVANGLIVLTNVPCRWVVLRRRLRKPGELKWRCRTRSRQRGLRWRLAQKLSKMLSRHAATKPCASRLVLMLQPAETSHGPPSLLSHHTSSHILPGVLSSVFKENATGRQRLRMISYSRSSRASDLTLYAIALKTDLPCKASSPH